MRQERKKHSYIKTLQQLEQKHGADLGNTAETSLINRGFKTSDLKTEIEDESQLKKVKNRESAKNSRERKRVYIQILEDKFNFQEQVIEDLRKQLTSIMEGYHPLENNSKTRILKSLQWAKKLDGSIHSSDTEISTYQVENIDSGRVLCKW